MRIILTSLLLLLPFVSAAESLSVEQFSMDKYKGKYLYVDFWASWCGPCRASFPWMNEMNKTYADQGLEIVAVNLDAEREDADSFLQEFPADFTVVFDPEATLAEKRDLLGMPSSFFYSPEGELLFSHIGFKLEERKQLREKIESHLKSRGGAL